MIGNANWPVFTGGRRSFAAAPRRVVVTRPSAAGLGQLPAIDWKIGLALAAGGVLLYMFTKGKKTRRRELRKARLKYAAEAAAIRAA